MVVAHTGHANDMSTWQEIACRRGPNHEHHRQLLSIDLARPHRFHDYPQVPARLARGFDLWIWDPDEHPVDDGPYCPAHDAVSATIVSHGIWEPAETIFTLAVCDADPPDGRANVLDFGAQLGWFSMLAAACGWTTVAYEADADQARSIEQSARRNGWWWERVFVSGQRIGPDTPESEWAEGRIRLAKVDVEGAEPDVVRYLWSQIECHAVDFLLIEVSPVFHDGYPAMVRQVVDAGYDAWLLPEKRRNPEPFGDDLPRGLRRIAWAGQCTAALEELVASWHQTNIVLSREGVEW